MQSRRLERLNELISQTVSQLLLNLKDPGVGFLTVTGAKLAPDLSLARIYYSVLGSDEEKKTTADALDRAKPYIRHELAKLKNLKKIPEVAFYYDDGPERADRVYRLLDTIKKEERPPSANGNPTDQHEDS